MTFCKACVHGKMHRLPHPPLKDIKSTEKLQLVQCCKPSHLKGVSILLHSQMITPDIVKTYFLKKKSEALQKFRDLKLLQRKGGQKC